MLPSAPDANQCKPKQATLEVGLEVLGEPTKLVKPDSMPDTCLLYTSDAADE